MSDDPNLQAALTLAAHGLAVFPCDPAKRPRPGLRWKEEATTDERRIVAWWRRWPGSLPAFEPGRAGHGLIVIDCDRHGGPDGVAAFYAAAPDEVNAPSVETPSGGRHIFFLNPAGLGNARGALPPGVDVRGRGGYVIAEGATLPDGRSYSPAPGGTGLVEALSAGAVPDLPEWLAAILTSGPQEREQRQIEQQPQRQIMPARDAGAREASAFAKALDDETRNVAQAGPGQRNHALNTAAFNLGQMTAAGWGAAAQVEAALTSAALACGLRQPEIRKTIASGLKGGAANPRPALAERQPSTDLAPIGVINGMTVDMTTGEILDEEDEEEESAPPIDEALTRIGGVLGEVVDWITDCGSTGNRVLALSAALPLMGTLLGRRMATPTRAGGNLELYVIATMESGAGKSDQRQAIVRIMEKLGLHNQHLARAFASGPALANHLCTKPLSLSIIDEISDYFEQMFGGKSHLQAVASIMKEAWGYGFSLYSTDASMTRGALSVHSPTWSVYGMTTNEDLFRVVKTKEVTSGFINRFLMFDAGRKTKQRPRADFREPPERLLKRLVEMYELGSGDTRGNIGTIGDKNFASDPHPVQTPWASAAAEQAYEDFEALCEERKGRDAVMGKLYARTSFMAIKMAAIRACGDLSPVTREHVEWGAAIALQSADRFHDELKANMVDPISYPELFRKIAAQFTLPSGKGHRLMEEYGPMTLPRQFLWENLKHHTGRNVFDFANALKAMKENGEIAMGNVTNRRTHRATECVTYAMAKRRKR